jgi:hypothetical protein
MHTVKVLALFLLNPAEHVIRGEENPRTFCSLFKALDKSTKSKSM